MSSEIAVLLPVYAGDTPSLLSEALLSILSQDIECFTINIYLGIDGPISKDLEIIIDAHRCDIFRVIRSEENVGLSQILNLLIEDLGEEQYVFRHDADDTSMKYRFRKQVEFFKAYPDVGVLGGAILELDGAGSVIGSRSYPKSNCDCKKYMSRSSPFAHPTVAFNRSAINCSLFYPNSRSNEDIRFWFYLAKNNTIFSNCSEVLVKFRFSEETFRRRGMQKSFGECCAYLSGMKEAEFPFYEYFFPLARLVFRFMPFFVSRFCYKKVAFRSKIGGGV